MATVTFIKEDGEKVVVEDAVGSLMEIATDNDIEGIDGDCGGVCSCSTCHVKVHRDWIEKLGKVSEIETELLELEDTTDERSRLCCQIEMSEEYDGLVVEIEQL
ncbi:MAG: 2Fe-2S iron-sulfur cluster-binding protein [Opitutaceae bacterium]